MPNELDPGGDLSRGRAAAYADLITAVLDLRSSVTTRAFDEVVSQAVADGRIAADLARELKWLQRQSLLDLVEHAERILPTTIVALEGVAESAEGLVDPEQDAAPASDVSAPADLHPRELAPPAVSPPDVSPPAGGTAEAAAPVQPPAEVPPQSVDLTARRLLVAGLRTIEDRPFP